MSGCSTRESATNKTPGSMTARLSFTTAFFRVKPCAFHGVSAQPRTKGNCLLFTSIDSGSLISLGKIGHQVRFSGSVKKAGPEKDTSKTHLWRLPWPLGGTQCDFWVPNGAPSWRQNLQKWKLGRHPLSFEIPRWPQDGPRPQN